MKKILFVLALLIIVPCIWSCSQDDQPIPAPATSQTVISDAFANDPLIINLQALNDSLLLQTKPETRGLFGNWFRKVLRIAVADILGAVKGAGLGSVFGPAGTYIGAVVVGAASSYDSYHSGDLNLSKASDYNFIPQEDVERAFIIARNSGDTLAERADLTLPDPLKIPQIYIDALKVGLYHNLTLRVIEDSTPLEFCVEDGLTEQEVTFLHSAYFTNGYNEFLSNPQNYSFNYAIANPTKVDRIIQLFVEVYQNYPADQHDATEVINQYIEVIESDTQITEEQKQIVYSALATAAFSTDYWKSQEPLTEPFF